MHKTPSYVKTCPINSSRESSWQVYECWLAPSVASTLTHLGCSHWGFLCFMYQIRFYPRKILLFQAVLISTGESNGVTGFCLKISLLQKNTVSVAQLWHDFKGTQMYVYHWYRLCHRYFNNDEPIMSGVGWPQKKSDFEVLKKSLKNHVLFKSKKFWTDDHWMMLRFTINNLILNRIPLQKAKQSQNCDKTASLIHYYTRYEFMSKKK